jgi:hypothetical protein
MAAAIAALAFAISGFALLPHTARAGTVIVASSAVGTSKSPPMTRAS